MPAPISRRKSLLHLGAWVGAVLCPARLSARPRKIEHGPTLTFAVANDFHHSNSDCDPWFNRLFQQISGHAHLQFCLALGDIADAGKKTSMEAVIASAERSGVHLYPTPGNHDNDLPLNTDLYQQVFPGRLNYTFRQGGWQFVAIDSTEGRNFKNTRIQPETLAWLDANLPKLDRHLPTLLYTHFPLGAGVPMRSLNADDVLARFAGHNLRAVLSGHHHGRTRTRWHSTTLLTNACCARVRGNHDGTKIKGYWLFRAELDGTFERTFIPFSA